MIEGTDSPQASSRFAGREAAGARSSTSIGVLPMDASGSRRERGGGLG